MKFLFKATLFYWVVWVVAKAATTYGAFYYPSALNGWYDFNSRIIARIPYYGENIRALVRDNIADGEIAFWEVWLGLGLGLAILRVVWRGFRRFRAWRHERRLRRANVSRLPSRRSAA